jgi:hypothetical protein
MLKFQEFFLIGFILNLSARASISPPDPMLTVNFPPVLTGQRAIF